MSFDEVCFKLNCSLCGIAEAQTITDEGNGYRGSSYVRGVPFRHFEVNWIGGWKTIPQIENATCKKCGASAHID